jgi:hypothetical protein
LVFTPRSAEIADFLLKTFNSHVSRVSPHPDELYRFVTSRLGVALLWAIEALSKEHDEKKSNAAKGMEWMKRGGEASEYGKIGMLVVLRIVAHLFCVLVCDVDVD